MSLFSLLTSGVDFFQKHILYMGFLFTLFVSLLSLLSVNTTNSASLSNWNAGRIIDDSVFVNTTTMSVASIQNFLSSKVPNCDTYGKKVSEYGGGTRAQWGQTNYNQSTFTCLKDYSEGGKSAAEIIYSASQEFTINPQVLIVLLQKEQGLVTDEWPLNIQYRSATGYGCPDTAVCDSQYYGFTNQVRWAARMFRAIISASPSWYTPYILGTNYIRYNPDVSCGGTNVVIQNRATQALYNYTPYQPNQAALATAYGSGDSCSAYGNRNFYSYFTDWFGSTYGTVLNGTDYRDVFDPTYYLNTYADINTALNGNAAAALSHFVNYGMSEGRRGSENFDINSYKTRYLDLRIAFRNNLKNYYLHYINHGKTEGRIAIGGAVMIPLTAYRGVDYSKVYDFNTYLEKNKDLSVIFSGDDIGALTHFVNYGMSEGRIASNTFIVTSYKNTNVDLRLAFRDNWQLYYLHYINYGFSEARTATGAQYYGVTGLGSINYSSVYNFSTYISNYADLRSVFGPNNDIGALMHFINYGMNEGRQASDNFNVQIYKNNYSDLRNAFGANLKSYYLHYINYGQREGREAF